MKSVVTNWRYYVLASLAFVAALGIFAVPEEHLPLAAWFGILLASKAVGAAAFCGLLKLIIVWDGQGLIPELSNLIKES